MGIKQNFSIEDVANRLNKFAEVIEKRIITRLSMLGEMCVTHARSNGDYIDQTGNLRSSVGYVVFKNGTAIRESYTQAKDGKEGVEKGRALALKVGSRFSEGICLVVTAGMSYAVSVESRGRDVIASAEVMAKQKFPEMIAQLKSNINSALK